MITIRDVTYHIDDKQILHDISLQLDEQQVIALIGPNGAGKSTLFSLMARLQPMQSGQICFDNHDISSTDGQILATVVAMLSQENPIQGRLRVHELLLLGRYPHHHGRPSEQDHQAVQQVIEQFELSELQHRFISTLSGGQRQRVLIAMVICQDTPYVLLDEPLNNLDMYHAGKLMRILRQLATEQNKTIVIVLHDINQAAQFADTVVMMQSGQIIAQGSPQQTLNKENIKQLYGVDVTVLYHHDRPVIVDEVVT